MSWLELVVRVFATFYLAVVFVKLFEDAYRSFLSWEEKYVERKKLSLQQASKRALKYLKIFDILHMKPFNCEFCMCFWWALIVSIPYFHPRVIFGVAGGAMFLVYLKNKLELVDFS